MSSFTVGAALAVAAGCSAPAPTPDAFLGFCSDQHPVAPTFTTVQTLFSSICTTCHIPPIELPLSPQLSYAALVNQPPPNYANPATDESCGVVLVKPGDPAGSYLYQKLSLTLPCAGNQMPLTDIGAPAPLEPCALAAVHDWIAAGAAND